MSRSSFKLSLKTENAILNITLSTLFFSFMQVIVKTLKDLPFFELIFFRAAVSLMFAYGALRVAKISPWPSNMKWMLVRALAGTVSLIAYFHSIQELSLTTAVTLQYLSPIFSVLWASLFFGEKSTPLQWFFLLTSFIGVYISKGFEGDVFNLNIFIGILGAALAGVSYNAIRLLKNSDPAVRIVFYFPLVAVLLSMPLAFSNWIWPSFDQWLLISALGLVTWLAQVFMTKAYQLGAPASVNIMSYTGLFYAAFFGYVFFDEKLTLIHSFGILVMVISVIISTWISHKKKKD